MFNTHDLIFRKVREEDLCDLLSLKEDSWLYTHHISFLNLADQKSFFDNLQSNVTQPKNLLLIACVGNKSIGMFFIANIDYVSRTADVGWAIFAPYRGQKYGLKLVMAGTNICFQILNLRRLSCEILYDNVASLKCAAHAGYVHEGVKRESVHKLGKYVDSIVLGVLIEEFKCTPISP